MTATTATVVDCRANSAQATKDTHPAAGAAASSTRLASNPYIPD
jgi:hypothetical protein